MIEIFGSSILATALVSLLIFALRNWFIARLKSGIKHEYDEKIEAIRLENSLRLTDIQAKLAEQSSLLSLAHKSYSDYALPFHTLRLESVKKLWDAFLITDAHIPAVVCARWDILLPSEYGDAKQKGDLYELPESEILDLLKAAKEIESCRPFVGEYLWNLYFIYRAVIGRTCYLYSTGYKSGNLSPWIDDNNLRTMVKTLLGDSEFERISKLQIGSFQTFRQASREMFAIAIGNVGRGRSESEEHMAALRQLAAVTTRT